MKAELIKDRCNKNDCHVVVTESIFTARNMDEKDMEKAYSLRHLVFAEELRWAPTDPSGLEVDKYDSISDHFGVFAGEELLAYLRLIRSDNRFMLENEFIELVSNDHTIRKYRDTSEISRLCLARRARDYKTMSTDFGTYDITMLLYKCVYRWCKENKVRYLYFVVAQQVFRLLNARGFPCDLVGEPKKMPDSIVAVAAILDWRKFEMRSVSKKPRLLAWLTNQPKSTNPREMAAATA
jgi:N-acyl amino acid synthase of PEP-CTERM/exosortase system